MAEVVKTTTDPYVGRISLVRVFSGTLRPSTTVHVSGHLALSASAGAAPPGHDLDERAARVSLPQGAHAHAGRRRPWPATSSP